MFGIDLPTAGFASAYNARAEPDFSRLID